MSQDRTMGSQDTHPQVSTRADKTASQLCTQSTTAVVARNMGQSGKRGAVRGRRLSCILKDQQKPT